MTWTNYLKKGFASITLVLLAVIVVIVFGFNKSFDFTGGSKLTVNAKDTLQTQAVQKVNDAFALHNNIKICSFSVDKFNDDTIITVKYQLASEENLQNQQIKDFLYAAFGYDALDPAQSSNIRIDGLQAAYGLEVFTSALWAVLISLVAVGFYVFLRFGAPSMFTLAACVITDIICFIALTAIFRIELSANIGFAAVGVCILSVIANTLMLAKLRANALDEQHKKLSNQEVANLTRSQIFKPAIIFSALAALVLIAFAIASFGTTGSAVLGLALSLISVFITALFINPALWELAFVRKNRAPKKHQIQIESETE